jgi:hypothetical protein
VPVAQLPALGKLQPVISTPRRVRCNPSLPALGVSPRTARWVAAGRGQRRLRIGAASADVAIAV